MYGKPRPACRLDALIRSCWPTARCSGIVRRREITEGGRTPTLDSIGARPGAGVAELSTRNFWAVPGKKFALVVTVEFVKPRRVSCGCARGSSSPGHLLQEQVVHWRTIPSRFKQFSGIRIVFLMATARGS